MKRMRKFWAILLTVILTLSMTLPAMAASPETPEVPVVETTKESGDLAEQNSEVVEETTQSETVEEEIQEENTKSENVITEDAALQNAQVSEEVLPAAGEGTVHVIIKNAVYPVADGAPWEGTIADANVSVTQDMTVMGAIASAAEANNITLSGVENNYIDGVNGLTYGVPTTYSGWMILQNDWFISAGAANFTVEAGDEVALVYSADMGEDNGGTWNNNDKTVKALDASIGTLSPAFDSTTHDYTLTVPEGTESVVLTPTASNKNFQVRTSVGDTEYKRTASIPVKQNTTIKVVCGDPSWPTMNGGEYGTADSVPAETYNIAIKGMDNAPTLAEGVEAQKSENIGKADTYSVDLSTIFADVDGDILTYKVSINDADPVAAAQAYSYKPGAAGSYTLVFVANDGEKDSTDSYTVNLAVENQAPVVKDGVEHNQTKDSVVGQYVSYTLSDFFADPDGDRLTYYYSVDGAEPASQSWPSYSYTASTAGTHTIEFYASDGTAVSDKVTVTLTAAAQLEITVTAKEGTKIYADPNIKTYWDYIWDSEENNKIQLEASVKEGPQDITWSSSGTAGTVDQNGLVTLTTKPTSDQTFVVYATGADNFSKAQYNINIKPEGVALGEDREVTLSQDGKADALTFAMANYSYSNGVDITMGDESIATAAVSNNNIVVQPLKPGTTTLTAVWKANPDVKDTINITVKGVGIYQEGETQDMTVWMVKNSSEKAMINLYALGETEDETFTWSSSDESVATVDKNGVVTGMKEGGTLITAVSSRSTAGSEVKGAAIVQVKGQDKIYLDDMQFTNYSNFEGWTTNNSEFIQAKTEYTITSKNASLASLMLKPFYDDTKYEVTAYFTDKTGADITQKLLNNTAGTLTNCLVPGDNNFEIKIYPIGKASEATTYTFHVYRPYTTTATISGMVVYPNGDAAATYPTYNGKAEATIFRGETTTTGWTSSVTDFTTYTFEDTTYVKLKPTLGNEFEKVRMVVNNGTPSEIATATNTKKITLSKSGTTTVKFYVISSDTYAKRVAAGIDDPYADPENIYTLTIKSVTADAKDMFITSATLSTGEFYAPGFASDNFAQSILVPYDADSTTVTFTAPAYANVYNGSVKDANLMTASETKDEVSTYSFETAPTKAVSIYLQNQEKTATYTYKFNCNRKGQANVQPDSIEEYLCLGSQYTNGTAYGMNPERTLVYGGGVLSLGNFGGHITYKYDEPIVNDPSNPYGIDFIAFGNCFAEQASAAEPGNVEVSKDGVTWYTLAGSVHYDDETDWNYTMTYTKDNNGYSKWTASDGTSGTNYLYPLAKNYPLYTWNDENQNSLTVSGVHIQSSETDPYGSKQAAYPDFGYVDSHSNNTNKGEATNPYLGSGKSKDGMFDLDWAVDSEGNPVHLDSVSYIRVSTASNIYAGAIGEKSTEITSIYRTQNSSDSAVGKTDVPVSITVDGQEVALQDGTYSYDVTYEGDFAVDVAASEEANIYINEARGNSRTFEQAPDKGIIRVIVQEGEKEPVIYYLNLTEKITPHWVTVDGKKYYVTADGSYAKGWKAIDSKWYYLDPATGAMKTGWQKVKGKWYYMNTSTGAMKSGWQKISGKWYYLGSASSGAMKSGWQKISGKWYYLSGANSGVMKTGWKKINNKWYYLGGADSGYMRTGWKTIGGKRYYFGGANSGYMRTGIQTIQGVKYNFGSANQGWVR